MLTPGQRFFEFDIIRLLGQGSFAAVYEAHDRMLDRQVAIKQLLLDKAKGEKAVKRFMQEARVAAALEHPNIVTIYNLRIEEKRIYIIMEYLPGGSLQDLLTQQDKLPNDQAVQLTTGICEGLAKLHAQGIIHRDIKADNILLTADNRPKVTDFGIVHVPQAMGGMKLTQAGFQPGTLLYDSPEQLRGEKLDARSDVYQVGELLYYMLSGKHYIDMEALEALSQAQDDQKIRSELKLHLLLEQAICKTIPSGLSDLWRDVGGLAGVVETAMAKDKEERFDNILEFGTVLKTIHLNTKPPAAKTSASLQDSKSSLSDARVYNERALTHAAMRNYAQAIYAYNQAIKLDPHYAEAYHNRSAAHLMMENYAQAVLDCERALELASHFTAAYINRGIAYTGLGNYEQALADYNKVVELKANYVYAYFNQGITRKAGTAPVL